MSNSQQKSLADLIARSVMQTPYEQQKEWLTPIAKSLNGIKRLSYDEKFMDVVAQSGTVPIASMIEQLREVPLPFKTIWLEGPAVVGAGKEFSNKENLIYQVQSGFLIKTLPDDRGFMFSSYASKHFTEIMHKQNIRGGILLPALILDDKVAVLGDSLDVRVSPDHLIELNDDYILSEMERGEKLRELGREAGINYLRNSDQIITDVYNEAVFVTRALVILTTGFATPGMSFSRTQSDIQGDASNKSRMAHGKRPLLATTPIIVDVAKVQQLRTKTHEQQSRLLLGITDVRAHQRTSKLGLKHLVRSHKRRIVAPVDRTEAPRILTASEQIALAVDGTNVVKVKVAHSQPIRTLDQPVA